HICWCAGRLLRRYAGAWARVRFYTHAQPHLLIRTKTRFFLCTRCFLHPSARVRTGGCVIARIRSHVQSKPLKTRVVCSFSAMAACGVKVDASGVIACSTRD
ncbi:hypothetical protein, partial [Phocaeicola dorei]|uniref:hypothetical protein n=1 Tax=Phocaeicola dorei TaxID=357276 RepID=UPI0032EE8290